MNIQSLNWISEKEFEIGGYTLTMDYEHGGSKIISNEKRFLLMKARNFLQHYLSLDPREYRKIIELGLYQGGSFVFLDQLLRPDRIVGVELNATPLPALDAYVGINKDRAHVYYGMSQDDSVSLKKIVDTDCNGQCDLVVDDASHFYAQTKTSFQTLFPLVRPGGLYIIEDWSWSFQDEFQKDDHPWHTVPSPANLIIDLMEDMIRGGLIKDIQITRPLIKIWRSDLSAGEVFSSQARRGRHYNLL